MPTVAQCPPGNARSRSARNGASSSAAHASAGPAETMPVASS